MKNKKFIFLREDVCNAPCPRCGAYTNFGHCNNCDGSYY